VFLAVFGGACAPRPPLVLLITIDTLRWDRLSLSGYPHETSPQIDALARDAVVFQKATSVAAWTRPAVASLLTGLDPLQHGALHWDRGLGDVETLAGRLQAAGWRTRAVTANPFLYDAGFERGFDVYQSLSGQDRWHVPARELNAAVMDAPLPEEPLLLYLHYLDPHDPYRPDATARAALVGPYEGSARGTMAYLREQLLARRMPVRPDDVRHVSDLYDAEIRTVDTAIGELVSWLRRQGAYEEAWVIVTSDHGEEFYEHGSWLHSFTLFEEQLRVPLIIKPPRSLGARTGLRDADVSLIDVVPTVLDGVGLTGADDLPGRSLMPILLGEAAEPGRVLFAIQPFADRVGRGATARASGFKWISVEGRYPHRDTPTDGECFDLSEDPGETRNRAAEALPECRALAEALAAWLATDAAEGAPLDVDAAVEERLRALGYVP
jgi:arylsulfatase A-like enzyme